MARLRFRRVAVSTVVRGGASGCAVACALFGCGVLECYRVALGWPRERSVLHVLLVRAQGRRARFPWSLGCGCLYPVKSLSRSCV